jgi:hypothetical protein
LIALRLSEEFRLREWRKSQEALGEGEAESRKWATGGLNLGKELWVQHFNDRGHMVSSSFAFAWSRAWKD